VLCWAVFLSYQVQIPYFILGQWIEPPRVTAAIFLTPLAAYLLGKAFRPHEQPLSADTWDKDRQT
jgi:hypothetical protein